ncbi:MAG TPA: hypothetical protein VI815_02620 [Candidatus Nanoarchaeia archaeon]|nr:hypothetical protein [Candidatus Nanoarchaeia archaeon]
MGIDTTNDIAGRPKFLQELFNKSKNVDGSRYKVIEGKRLNNKVFQTSLGSQKLEQIDIIWKQNNPHLKKLDAALRELEKKWEEETDLTKKEILFYKYELEVESFFEPGIELDEFELKSVDDIKRHILELERALKDR